jgi:predicted lactoylglutathione lyase
LSLFTGQSAQCDVQVCRRIVDGDHLVARSRAGDDGDVSVADGQSVGQGAADGFVGPAIHCRGGDGDDQGQAELAVPSAADRWAAGGWTDPDRESVFGHRRLSGYPSEIPRSSKRVGPSCRCAVCSFDLWVKARQGAWHTTTEEDFPMSTEIFLNLPVKNVAAAQRFYTGLGYSVNPQFTGENSACLVISEHITAMLLSEPHFKEFTSNEIADTARTTEVIIALSAQSRTAVDELADKALATGGSEPKAPQDHGFMYGRSFTDPDGHHWEVIWMDPAAQGQG